MRHLRCLRNWRLLPKGAFEAFKRAPLRTERRKGHRGWLRLLQSLLRTLQLLLHCVMHYFPNAGASITCRCPLQRPSTDCGRCAAASKRKGARMMCSTLLLLLLVLLWLLCLLLRGGALFFPPDSNTGELCFLCVAVQRSDAFRLLLLLLLPEQLCSHLLLLRRLLVLGFLLSRLAWVPSPHRLPGGRQQQLLLLSHFRDTEVPLLLCVSSISLHAFKERRGCVRLHPLL